MKATGILLASGAGLLAVTFVLGIYVVPRAQAGSPQTARQSDASRVAMSDFYVDVTYATPAFVQRVKLEPYLAHYQGHAQPFLIGLNTHVGSIEQVDLRGKVLLQDSRGDQFPALGAPVVLSEHHNMYLLSFPLLDHHGQPIFAPTRGHFRLLVLGVGKTAQRVFEWKLPIVEPSPVRNLANTLVLALGVIGALMVILSPCAIELTTYYTGIIAGVVSSAALTAEASPRAVRRRILVNLAGFVAGFTCLYMASGATVGLLGQKLMNLQNALNTEDAVCNTSQPAVGAVAPTTGSTSAAHASHGLLLGSWTHLANGLGAAFLVYFALRSLGRCQSVPTCLVWLAQAGRKIRAGLAWVVGLVSARRAAMIRRPCLGLRDSANLTPANSFCAGLGLSVSCLTCMGGAILYPLLIFVGTSTWYWGALILSTYSLALALPMAAIAVAIGDFAWQYVRHPRWVRGLQWTSALIMLGVAVLILFDRTRFINTVVFSVLNAVGGDPNSVLAKL